MRATPRERTASKHRKCRQCDSRAVGFPATTLRRPRRYFRSCEVSEHGGISGPCLRSASGPIPSAGGIVGAYARGPLQERVRKARAETGTDAQPMRGAGPGRGQCGINPAVQQLARKPTPSHFAAEVATDPWVSDVNPQPCVTASDERAQF